MSDPLVDDRGFDPGVDPGVDPRVQERDARHRAVAWLSRREYAVGELTEKLSRASFSPEVVQVTLAWLTEHDLVSDERFAEAFCRRRARQGYGPLRTRAELKSRGVSAALAATAINREDWYEAARAAYLKRYGTLPISDLKERAKRQRYLAQRGFSHDIVRTTMDMNHSEHSS